MRTHLFVCLTIRNWKIQKKVSLFGIVKLKTQPSTQLFHNVANKLPHMSVSNFELLNSWSRRSYLYRIRTSFWWIKTNPCLIVMSVCLESIPLFPFPLWNKIPQSSHRHQAHSTGLFKFQILSATTCPQINMPLLLHVTWTLASDWSRGIMWPGYWPLIGLPRHPSPQINMPLLLHP